MKIKNTKSELRFQWFKRKASYLTRRSTLQKLRTNIRAVSPVISSIILVAAVIVLGFVALVYARGMASDYQVQFREDVNSDISKLKENLSSEYIFYNGTGYLSIYFMNTGSNILEIDKVYLSTSSTGFEPTVRYLSGGLISLSVPGLASGSYTLKITTMRGSGFEYTFVV